MPPQTQKQPPSKQSPGNQQLATAPSEDEHSLAYVPLGEKGEIKLTVSYVQNFLSARTKKGHVANKADCVKFMMLCKARELNPWAGDAYLVGYDTVEGPVFNLITAQQALLKRAENNPTYNGMESGVIVQLAGGEIQFREGDFVLPDEVLLGGWAKVFRADRDVPSYDALNLSVYNKGQSVWKNDPAGMIVKCAESSALRKAFPTQLGGLYTQEERGAIEARGAIETHVISQPPEQPPRITRGQAISEQIQHSRPEPQQDPSQAKSEPEQPEQQDQPGSLRVIPPPPVAPELNDFASAILDLSFDIREGEAIERLVKEAKQKHPNFVDQINAFAQWKRSQLTDTESLFPQ